MTEKSDLPKDPREIVTEIINRDSQGNERTLESKKKLSDFYFAAKVVAEIYTGKRIVPLNELNEARDKLNKIAEVIPNYDTTGQILDAILIEHPTMRKDKFLPEPKW